MSELTFGERLVRSSFNPAERADVKEAKRLCAELIDFAESFIPRPESQPGNVKELIWKEETRLLRVAIERFEEGCMWLVKGLTVEQSK
jgi:hypothetical protein